MTREASPHAVPPRSASQERRHVSETSWIGDDLRRRHVPRVDPKREVMAPSDDFDYDLWEQRVSADDLRQVREELQQHSGKALHN